MIEQINKIAEIWWSWMWPMFWQVGVLIVLLGVVDLVIRKRVWPQLRYALWLLVLVKLVLPPTFSLSTSLTSQLQPLAKQVLMRQTGIGGIAAVPNLERDLTTAKPLVNTSIGPSVISQETGKPDALVSADREVGIVAPAGAVKPSWHVYVMLVWLLGTLILATWLVVKLRQLRGPHRGKVDVAALPPWFGKLLADTAKKLNLRRLPEVAFSETVVCPAVFGIFRPILLLPKGNITGFSRKDTGHILLHELAHIKRGDLWVHSVYMVLQVVYWFNPMLWFVRRQLRHLRELCCDATVGRILQEKTVDYRQTILENARRFLAKTVEPGMGLLGLFEDSNRLLIRLKWLEKKTWKYYHLRSATILAVVALMLACVLPMAKAQKSDKADMPVSSGADTDERIFGKSGAANAATKPEPPTTLRKVWSGPGVDFYGAPSPDGRYLSYVDWGATDLNHNDLAIYEIATGKKHRLTDNASWYESDEYQFALFSRWSPDGKQIAYQWWSNLIELCVIGLDGSKPRILYSSEEKEWARPYDWTPDGRQILACITEKDGKNKIALVSAADGSVRVLKTLDKYYGLRDSSWYTPNNMNFSPDGRYIVYDFPQKEDSHDISLMSTDGSREIPLVEHPAHDSVIGWAPDGKNILFASDRTGTMGVWLIEVAEGKPQGAPELVTPDIGRFLPMGFTGDGSLYYCHRPNKTDVYITEIDPETGKIVVPPHEAIKSFVESNATPAYSPNGKYLAYISRRPPLMKMRNTTISIGNVLCIRSLETGEEREFKPEINSFGFPQWSPDSRSIMVVNFEDDNKHAGHYRIDAQTGEVKLVVMSEDNRVHAHLWCADGKSIFLVRSVRTGDRDKDFCQIVVRDIESGAETELYRGSRSDVFTISRSPDGKWLAFLDKAKKRTLRIMPATGGEPREIHIFDKEDNRYITHTWTADGKYILMPKFRPPKADGKWDLWRIPVEDGDPQNFGFEMASIWQLSAHPDGQHIAFSTTTSRPAEVWVMENFLPTGVSQDK